MSQRSTVGTPVASLALLVGAILSQATPQVQGQCLDHSLPTIELISPPGGTSEFGASGFRSVVATDNLIIVGDFAAGGFVGRVVVYKHDGAQWNQHQILTPTPDPNEVQFVWYGRVIDLDGNRLVVGAENENYPNSAPQPPDGCIYVYEYDGTDFQFKTKLFPPVDHGVDGVLTRFGSLATQGEWVMAGKSDEPVNYNDLFIFKQTGENWALHQSFVEIVPQDLFLSGSYATHENNNWCLELQGDTWVFNSTGCDPMPAKGGIGIDGNFNVHRFVNGQWQQDAIQAQSENVFSDQRIHIGHEVFTFDGQAWTSTGEKYALLMLSAMAASERWVVSKGWYPPGEDSRVSVVDLSLQPPPAPTMGLGIVIDNPAPDPWDSFGSSVDLGWDGGVVGLSGESAAQTPAGSGLVFQRTGQNWTSTVVLSAAVQGFSYVGSDVAVAGQGDDTVIVLGGHGYCEPQGAVAINPGQVFVSTPNSNQSSGWATQELQPLTATSCNGPTEPWDGWNMSVAAAADGADATVAVSYPGREGNFNASGGAVEIFDRSGGVWTNSATIIYESWTAGDQFGETVHLQRNTNGELLLSAYRPAAGRLHQYLRVPGSAVWQPWGNISISSGVIDIVESSEGLLLITPGSVRSIDAPSTTTLLMNYNANQSGPVACLDAMIDDEFDILTIAQGAPGDAVRPIVITQMRPLEGSWCTQTRDIPLVAPISGLGDSVALNRLDSGQLTVLAGAPGNLSGGLEGAGQAVLWKPSRGGGSQRHGDQNQDGRVDIEDVLITVKAWGSCQSDCRSDLNGDGVVDVIDLLDVLFSWTG